METRFQTSFIPKKPLIPASSIGESHAASAGRHFGSLFLSIAVVLFVISLAAVAGAYLWKSYLLSAQASYKTQLAAREQQFNLNLIEELEEESVKINIAKQLLASHIAASGIFGLIGDLTAENVRFTSLSLTAPAGASGGPYKVSLSGYGQNLSAVAFQSRVLGELQQYGLANIVKNPILSNPSLNSSGSVSFSLSATIDPSVLLYEKSAAGSAAGTAATAAPAAAASSTAQ